MQKFDNLGNISLSAPQYIPKLLSSNRCHIYFICFYGYASTFQDCRPDCIKQDNTTKYVVSGSIKTADEVISEIPFIHDLADGSPPNTIYMFDFNPGTNNIYITNLVEFRKSTGWGYYLYPPLWIYDTVQKKIHFI